MGIRPRRLNLRYDAFPGRSIAAAKRSDSEDFLPTRWSGNRCIDYLITMCNSIILSDEAISDHKILCADFTLDNQVPREFPTDSIDPLS